MSTLKENIEPILELFSKFKKAAAKYPGAFQVTKELELLVNLDMIENGTEPIEDGK